MDSVALGRMMGGLHPILVHFPLVLWPLALVLDAVGVVRKDERCAWTARLLMLVGTLFALPAFLAGIFAEMFAARAGTPNEPMELHEFAAIATTWIFIALTATRLFVRPARAYLTVGALAVGLLIYTGYLGGEVVYSYGASVKNVTAWAAPTPEDLWILKTQQPLQGILYSDWMHNIFGGVVLAVAFLLLMAGSGRAPLMALQWVVPILFIGGGGFLWIFSDWDSWPLSDILPITDKEVLLHKVIATLLIIFGLAMMKRKAEIHIRVAYQNRVMAVLAIIGGALLLTHIHSVAPYSNVAVGVYLHHCVLGLLALGIGFLKLYETHVPAARWAVPSMMALLGLVLLTYNEGLPWYLGNVRHPRPGPNQGLVAQIGQRRGELVFENGVLEVRFWKLHEDTPAPLRATAASAVVRAGGRSTLLPLTPVDVGEEGIAHFRAAAPFLEASTVFETHLRVEHDGRGSEVEFEPWVAEVPGMRNPALPAPAYACPMHPHAGGSAPGACPQCGMALIKDRGDRMHDDNASLIFAAGTPRAGNPTTLTFQPRVDGNAVDLEIVHERPMHVIVVRGDLSHFKHVHPVLEENGALRLRHTFPTGGTYYVYADFTPRGAGTQVFRETVDVAGPAGPAAALRPTETDAVLAGGMEVAMHVMPRAPRAKDEAMLSFVALRNGEPVNDLRPFLGARGHLIAICEDGAHFAHAHVLDGPGKALRFEIKPPHAGLYKVWVQFADGAGKVVTAPFVLRVH
ncbi:MAG: DUF2231 domain-containing protein [Armatimonadetes bacterium]|nr:DUF2231 domain-containing protein [Armatimonadota bacterium]